MTSVRALRLAFALAAGCAACVRQARTVSASVDAVYGEGTPAAAVGGFVAAVPAFETRGRCRVTADSAGRTLLMRYAGPRGVERMVALTLAPDGRLRRYSDERGDLRPDGTGPKTVVAMEMDHGFASAFNLHAPSPATQGLMVSHPPVVMDMASWGTPRRMIEAVRAGCRRAERTFERG